MTLKRPTTPQLPVYDLIEDPLDDIYSVSILTGEAAGFVFKYRQVQFIPEGGQLRIKFNYCVVANPDSLTSDVLVPIMSLILDDILQAESQELNG
jgi:hypothetical protein